MEVAVPVADKQHSLFVPKVSCTSGGARSMMAESNAALALKVEEAGPSSRIDKCDAESNFISSANFTIRGFVSHVRKQDIRKTWPFSEELLQRYLNEGKSLPQLDVPHSLSSGDAVVDNGTVTAVGAGECQVGRQELELQLDLEQHEEGRQAKREKLDKNQEMSAGGDSQKASEMRCQEQALEALQQLRVAEQDTASYVDCVDVVVRACSNLQEMKNAGQISQRQVDDETEVKEKAVCVEDKASDTGDEKAQADVETKLEDIGGAGVVKASGEDEKVEGQQQNVCPVCTSFSCHSVTALNAHMDGCLSSSSMEKNQKLRSKSSKMQKMRSITDIIAADPSPSPKQSDSMKQSDPVVRERRAPNHVVVLAEKGTVSKSSCGRPHRHLRSRSRGSIPSPKVEAERSIRRRRRECAGNSNQKSGERSEKRRKRHCSGNSMEVTSSWTPSISSGTYCNSKNQDTQVEKSSADQGDKRSESHGSANCFGPLHVQPMHDADIDLSSKEKELDKAERSSCTGTVRAIDDVCTNNKDIEKPQVPAQADASSVPQAVPLEVAATGQVTDDDAKMESDDKKTAPAIPCNSTKEAVSALEVVDASPSSRTISTLDSQKEAIPERNMGISNASTAGILQEHLADGGMCDSAASQVVIVEATLDTTKQTIVPDLHHCPKPTIPLYDSVISSLRSCTGVDSLTGYSQCNPTWKAAVVMATLGASLVKTTVAGSSSTPATCASTVGNKSEVSVSQVAQRNAMGSQASDSICVSAVPNVSAVSNSEGQLKASALSTTQREHLHTEGIPLMGNIHQAKTTGERGIFKEPSDFPVQHGYLCGDNHLHVPGTIGTGSKMCSTGLDRSRFASQSAHQMNHGEAVQMVSGSSCHSKSQISKIPMWMGDRPAVIDVDQESSKAQASSDGKGEKPVLRLLGQNVMVESAASGCSMHKDTPGSKSSYAFSVPAVHSGGSGYQAPCCCNSRSTPGEHIAFALGKDLPISHPNGKNMSSNGTFSQIPLSGTWRLVPNGIINQVNAQQLNFQSGGPDPRKMGNTHVNGNACCIHKNCAPVMQQGRPAGDQESSMRAISGSMKHAGELPPWLLAAKKQKEAEFAANVIVIDDDEPEENKVVSHANPKSAANMVLRQNVMSSSNADIQFSGSLRAGSHQVALASTSRHMSACSFPSGEARATQITGRKREAGEWNVSSCQQVEKAPKAIIGDSPAASRMGIPVLVPTWMITNSPSNTPKRGATAQTYKARIAMMKAYMHGNLNESNQVASGMVSHQGSLIGQSNCLHQAPNTQGTRVLQFQGGDYGANQLNASTTSMISSERHQQLNPLVFGKDCHIIELDNGQCLLVNGHIEAEQSSCTDMLPSTPTCSQHSSLPADMSLPFAHGKSFRDNSGRNFIICNDHERHGPAHEQFLMTPILQPSNGIVIGDGQTPVVPLSVMQRNDFRKYANDADSRTYFSSSQVQQTKGILNSPAFGQWAYGQKNGK